MEKVRELWEGLKTGWYLGTMFAGIDWPPWRRQSAAEQGRWRCTCTRNENYDHVALWDPDCPLHGE